MPLLAGATERLWCSSCVMLGCSLLAGAAWGRHSCRRPAGKVRCSPLSFLPSRPLPPLCLRPSPDTGLRCRSPRSSAFLLLSAPCPNARSSRCRLSHSQHLFPNFTTLHSKLTLVSSRHHVLFFSRRGCPQRRRVTTRLRRAHACTPVRCTNFFCILCFNKQ